MSKAGLLLSAGLSLEIDVSDKGVAEEHSELWLTWVGTAIADAVSQLASIPAGNVETTVTCADPRAADMAAFGGGVGASFPCDAKVRASSLHFCSVLLLPRDWTQSYYLSRGFHLSTNLGVDNIFHVLALLLVGRSDGFDLSEHSLPSSSLVAYQPQQPSLGAQITPSVTLPPLPCIP